MEIAPQIFFSKVMHKRMFPKVNSFDYSVYYLALPLHTICQKTILGLKFNKFGLISFYEEDHGKKDGSDIKTWVLEALKEKGIEIKNPEIMLICMPRILGYVFNPISFYFCFDDNKKLIAVVNEVNNTFGESHSYICAKDDRSEITPIDILEAEKIFHVSPFLKREGKYQFRFDYRKDKLGVWIDYFDAENKKELITSLIGGFEPLNKNSLNRAFLKHPLVTIKAIVLIHFQAIKLILKKVKYIVKPQQLSQKITLSSKLTKS